MFSNFQWSFSWALFARDVLPAVLFFSISSCCWKRAKLSLDPGIRRSYSIEAFLWLMFVIVWQIAMNIRN